MAGEHPTPDNSGDTPPELMNDGGKRNRGGGDSRAKSKAAGSGDTRRSAPLGGSGDTR